MVNLASTPNEKVEVLCKPQLLHQRGGCFNPQGLRKVPVAVVPDVLVQAAPRLMWAFCFPKDWDY